MNITPNSFLDTVYTIITNEQTVLTWHCFKSHKRELEIIHLAFFSHTAPVTGYLLWPFHKLEVSKWVAPWAAKGRSGQSLYKELSVKKR